MGDPVSLVASPLINSVVSLTSNFISKQYHLIHGVKNEVVKLKSNLSQIQATLHDAENYSCTNSEQLRDWLMKLEDAALDAEDVLESYATEASLRKILKKHNPISSACKRREAALNIKKIATRIADITEERGRFHFGEERGETREEGRPKARGAGHVPPSDIYGRKEERSNIIAWLTSEEQGRRTVPVLPIIGMAGLGKTTLAQLIYNDDTMKDHFTDFIWVDVKREFDLERVGREMVEFVSKMKLDVIAWSSVEKRIVEVLAGKKFLLVLDDLWTADSMDWGTFHELLKKGKEGSRVLVTTRTKEIVKTVGASDPLFLGHLQEEECWSMFANVAFEDGKPRDPKLEATGRRIVDKCGGLPLAVFAMAKLLSSCDCDQGKWSRIEKDSIWETELQNVRDGKPTILAALRLSYEHLQPHLKQCFRYCGMFPKGYMFSKIELVKLWMAQGYVDLIGQSKLDQIGGDYFDVLQSRSFFQSLNIDKKERYRIHDLFHDLAASVSEQSSFRFEDNKTCSLHGNSRHVSFFCEDVETHASDILKATKLRTILLPINRSRNFGKVLDKIFCPLIYLRVLDLSSSTMTELPESVGKLKLLRYLDLSHTEIRGLPNGICKLINLQTLKLLGCVWLYELPKGFNNLTNLWHLELDEMFWKKCTHLPPGVGTLTNLQNLHLFRVGRDSVNGVSQLQSMSPSQGNYTFHILKTLTLRQLLA